MEHVDDRWGTGMTNRETSRLKPDSACMRGFRGKPGMRGQGRLEMTICGSELMNVRLIQRTLITDFVTLPNPSNQSTSIVYVDHRLPGSSCENHFSHKMELRPSRHQLL